MDQNSLNKIHNPLRVIASIIIIFELFYILQIPYYIPEYIPALLCIMYTISFMVLDKIEKWFLSFLIVSFNIFLTLELLQVPKHLDVLSIIGSILGIGTLCALYESTPDSNEIL